MEYLNPYSLFQIPWGNGPDADTIRFAKKRALAEFELSQKTTVEFAGKQLNKADVLAAFVLLEKENQARWLWEMGQNADLAHFILSKGLNAHPPQNWGPVQDPAYRVFTKDWIPLAIRNLLSQSLAKDSGFVLETTCAAIMAYAEFDKRYMLQPIIEFLKVATLDLQAAQQKGASAKKYQQQFLSHTENHILTLLNGLAPSLKPELERWALEMQSLAKHLEGKMPEESQWIAALHEAVICLGVSAQTRMRSQEALLAYMEESRIWRTELGLRLKYDKTDRRESTKNTLLGFVILIGMVLLGLWLLSLAVRMVFPSSILSNIKEDLKEIETSLPAQGDSVGNEPYFPEKPVPDPMPGQ